MQIDTYRLGLLTMLCSMDRVTEFLIEIDETCRDKDGVINNIPDSLLLKYGLLVKKDS